MQILCAAAIPLPTSGSVGACAFEAPIGSEENRFGIEFPLVDETVLGYVRPRRTARKRPEEDDACDVVFIAAEAFIGREALDEGEDLFVSVTTTFAKQFSTPKRSSYGKGSIQ